MYEFQLVEISRQLDLIDLEFDELDFGITAIKAALDAGGTIDADKVMRHVRRLEEKSNCIKERRAVISNRFNKISAAIRQI